MLYPPVERYISPYRQRAIGLMKVKGPGDRPL
jgi:hypothetical protein